MRNASMREYRIGLYLFSFCLMLAPSLVASAPSSSSNYTITRSVMDSGGDTSTSTSYKIQSSVGQTGGTSASTNFTIYAGFISTTDTDGDGVLDSVDNCITDSNPTQLNTDGDTDGDVCDIDDDNDGLTDNEEDTLGTSRILVDSDDDGLNDAEEVSGGNPIAYDVGVDTDPTNPDTDGDTLSDGDEVIAGSDPLDPFSPPATTPVSAPVTSAPQLTVLFGLLLLGGWFHIRRTYKLKRAEFGFCLNANKKQKENL